MRWAGFVVLGAAAILGCSSESTTASGSDDVTAAPAASGTLRRHWGAFPLLGAPWKYTDSKGAGHELRMGINQSHALAIDETKTSPGGSARPTKIKGRFADFVDGSDVGTSGAYEITYSPTGAGPSIDSWTLTLTSPDNLSPLASAEGKTYVLGAATATSRSIMLDDVELRLTDRFGFGGGGDYAIAVVDGDDGTRTPNRIVGIELDDETSEYRAKVTRSCRRDAVDDSRFECSIECEQGTYSLKDGVVHFAPEGAGEHLLRGDFSMEQTWHGTANIANRLIDTTFGLRLRAAEGGAQTVELYSVGLMAPEVLNKTCR